MNKKTKILWIGDGGVATGFSNVNHAIIENLPPDEYDIRHLAVNYKGDWTETVSWHKLYPAMLGGDYLGRNRIKSFIEKFKPDLVFILNDLWITKDYLPYIPHEIPVVTYFPVDAGPVQEEWVKEFGRVEQVVAYTKYGKMEFQKVMWRNVDIIPHGIDLTKFYPIPKQAACKLLNDAVNPNDWTVFNGNRNQPRKRLDLTIRGFCEFAKDKPESVRLYLHTGIEDAGWRIDTLMERYNQAKRLYITSPHLSPANAVSIEQLNIIYNCCDIGINTSLGEGWGLVPFEMAATNKLQLVPANSANLEIFNENKGILMPVQEESIIAPHIMTEGTAPSIETVAQSLEYAYTHPEEMREMSQTMYEYIQQPEFQWSNIALKWHKIFQDILR